MQPLRWAMFAYDWRPGAGLIEDAGSVLMHLYLTDPWTIAASVAFSAVVLIANAAQSWRWPQPLADRYDSPAMPVAAAHSGTMDRYDNLP